MPKLSDREIAYKRAFATDPGLQVLKDLKAWLHHGQTIGIHKSDRELCFEIGRQSVINDIIYILEKEDNGTDTTGPGNGNAKQPRTRSIAK